MNYLLDTNVFVHVGNSYEGWTNIAQHLDRIDHQSIFVSVGTVFEISRMVERGKLNKVVMQACVNMLELFQVITLDEQKSALAGSVHAWYMNHGHHVSDVDAMIVATAISHKLCVVTDDTKMHAFPSVQLANWVRE